MDQKVVQGFIAYLSTLTDSERMDVFGEIHDVFCEHCGIKMEKEGCYCWNDE